MNYERLCKISADKNWPEFQEIIKPKDFIPDGLHEKKIDRKIIGKLSETLTKPDLDLPKSIQITIMKCLINSCTPKSIQLHKMKSMQLDFLHMDLDLSDVDCSYQLNCCNKLYERFSKRLDEIEDAKLADKLRCYPESRFYYDGIVRWVVNFLSEMQNSNFESNDEEKTRELIRICFSFLCNITAIPSLADDYAPKSIFEDKRLAAITKFLLISESSSVKKESSVLRTICSFLNNIFNLKLDFFSPLDLPEVTRALLTAVELEISSANSSLISLTNRPKCLIKIYDELMMNQKLYLLEMIYQNLKELIYNLNVTENQNSEVDQDDTNIYKILPDDAIQFLARKFKMSTDLIMKSANVDEKTVEPVEVTIILDILGVLTSSNKSNFILTNDTSLLINAVYMLRGIHMAGKEQNNYFTPLQSLNDLAPNVTNRSTVENHPAFGFKAALIRLIGNLVYKHRSNQDTVREIEGIPLLLDCCNIDARNPLIMQWTILAIRNLCENNPENQSVIGNSSKIKFLDNQVVRELGVTLNQDDSGNLIGVVPLPKSN